MTATWWSGTGANGSIGFWPGKRCKPYVDRATWRSFVADAEPSASGAQQHIGRVLTDWRIACACSGRGANGGRRRSIKRSHATGSWPACITGGIICLAPLGDTGGALTARGGSMAGADSINFKGLWRCGTDSGSSINSCCKRAQRIVNNTSCVGAGLHGAACNCKGSTVRLWPRAFIAVGVWLWCGGAGGNNLNCEQNGITRHVLRTSCCTEKPCDVGCTGGRRRRSGVAPVGMKMDPPGRLHLTTFRCMAYQRDQRRALRVLAAKR